jgi:hypothetical protein
VPALDPAKTRVPPLVVIPEEIERVPIPLDKETGG